MKTCFHLVSLALAMTLTSCNSPAVNGLLNVPMRLLQAVGRTVGSVAQNDEPATDAAAVAARGQQIQQQGPHGTISTAPGKTAVVQR